MRRELGLPSLRLDLQQVLGQRGAGVADQDIDTAHDRVGAGDHRGDRVGVGHIGGEELSLMAPIPDVGARLGPRGMVNISNDDVCSFGCEGCGCRPADPVGPSGHDRALALETHR